MSSKKRQIQSGQESEEKLVLTKEIPIAYVAEYKAQVAQAATKAGFNIIAAQKRQTVNLRNHHLRSLKKWKTLSITPDHSTS